MRILVCTINLYDFSKVKKQQGIIREACVDNLEDALRAEDHGAERIELCSRLDLDGLTPGPALLEKVMKRLSIPVHAMARPRGGDFVFTPVEVQETREHIDLCRSFNVAGIVIGLLKADGSVDLENTRHLAAYAAPLKVTFHKAIDVSANILQSLEQLAGIPGITGILTSGGEDTAVNGSGMLKKMLEHAGDELEIIVAGKVTSHNLNELHAILGARVYHGKRIVYD